MAWLKCEQEVKALLVAGRTTTQHPQSCLVEKMKNKTISIIGWRRMMRNWRGPPTWKIKEWRSRSQRCRTQPLWMLPQSTRGRRWGMSANRNTGWKCSSRTRWSAMRWRSVRKRRIERTWKCFNSRRTSAILRNRHSSLVWMTSSMPTRRKRMQSWGSGATPRPAQSAVKVWSRWRKICWIGQRWPFAASKNSRWTCRGWNSIRVSTNRCSQATSLTKTSAQICSSHAKQTPLSKPSALIKAYRTNSTALLPILNIWHLRFPWIGTRKILTQSKNLSLRSKLIEQILVFNKS